MSKSKYTKKVLEEAVRQNISMVGTMRTLGAPLSSGSLRKKLTKLVRDYEIDTSHFLGMNWNKGKGINHKGGVTKKLIRPEDERKCLKCGVIKLAMDFYQRKKKPRAGDYYEKCKNCMKIRGRSYFYLNHDRQLYLAKLRKERYKVKRRHWLKSIKGIPCMDCGVKYPSYMMDFDHREGEVKIASISWMALRNTSNFKKIKAEIAKCDLVCANCHRQRTHDRIHKKIAAVTNVVKVEV